ncbi:MAG: rod shape-determining protein MreC [Acidobacteria bacterium]|nr:rod shape-determining protein MreC [Acidobacteriota bacterium]
MALLDIRQRAGYLFVAVMLGHVILISAQVQSKSGVPLIADVAFGIFAELQLATSAAAGVVERTWSGYVSLRGVHQENEALKRQLAAAEIGAQEQRAMADRARGLERLLELQSRLALKTTAAEVIAASATLDFRALTIGKGSRHGLRRDMAVIAPAGVVGRIVATSPGAAHVQLLTDVNAAAGAVIERSRAQGIIVGAGDKGFLLSKVSEVADIVVGDLVVTSGIEGRLAIYPKGFVIGRVETVQKIGSAYDEITVRPAVDFSSLEEVLVVLTPPPVGEPPEEVGH